MDARLATECSECLPDSLYQTNFCFLCICCFVTTSCVMPHIMHENSDAHYRRLKWEQRWVLQFAIIYVCLCFKWRETFHSNKRAENMNWFILKCDDSPLSSVLFHCELCIIDYELLVGQNKTLKDPKPPCVLRNFDGYLRIFIKQTLVNKIKNRIKCGYKEDMLMKACEN